MRSAWMNLWNWLGWSWVMLAVVPAKAQQVDAVDVLIYGATPSGIMASIQAARMGLSVRLLEPTQHVGGLVSGGLGATDLEHKEVYGGLAREFFQRVARHYAKDEAWFNQTFAEYREMIGAYHGKHLSDDLQADDALMFTFEPKIAQQLLVEMMHDAGVKAECGMRLRRPGGVRKVGARLLAMLLEDGTEVEARYFIDATYEGDLLAEAGASFHVGREANSVYGERWNGVQPNARGHEFLAAVDPYKIPGQPESGLLWGIDDGPLEPDGSGDSRLQAYCLRLTLTNDPDNRLPIERPEGYDPERYELLARALDAGAINRLLLTTHMPNKKTDSNNYGPFSTDYLGGNQGWVEASYTEREALYRDHRDYVQGLLWFVQNDNRVADKHRPLVAQWGLCKDEFIEHGGWTPQLYVREGRRLIGSYIMTEADCIGERVPEQPVGMACYGLDSHHVRRYVKDGRVLAEGNVQVSGLLPYPIDYRALLPLREECDNLMVSLCLSSSHMAYGSIRMEPVFMVLGQSAATAVALALENNVSLHELDYQQLRARLLHDGQIIVEPAHGLRSQPKLKERVF